MRHAAPPPLRAKGDIKHLRPLLRYLKPYRWRIAAASVALLFTSSAVLGMGSGLRRRAASRRRTSAGVDGTFGPVRA